MTSRPLLQTKTLRVTVFFKSASCCGQFVRIVHKIKSMKSKNSVMGFFDIKARLFKMMSSIKDIIRASHTKNDGVKDDYFSLQALAENVGLIFNGLQSLSRPCIFTVLDIYEMYFPPANIKLVSSA